MGLHVITEITCGKCKLLHRRGGSRDDNLPQGWGTVEIEEEGKAGYSIDDVVCPTCLSLIMKIWKEH